MGNHTNELDAKRLGRHSFPKAGAASHAGASASAPGRYPTLHRRRVEAEQAKAEAERETQAAAPGQEPSSAKRRSQ